MLTRLPFDLPLSVEVGGDLRADIESLAREHNRLLEAVRGALESLNKEGVLDVADAAITASRGIKFPATQNASSNANTLDDYKEVTNQAITVTSSAGTITTVSGSIWYEKIGREVAWQANITITTNGTGSGFLTFEFPFSVVGIAPIFGSGVSAALTGSISGTTAGFTKYDGTYPGSDGASLTIGGTARI